MMGGVAPMLPAKSCADMSVYLTNVRQKISYKLPADCGKSIKAGFKIARDGTLSDLKIEKSSGDKKLDAKALASIKKAAPFEKLPSASPVPFKADVTFE